MAQQIQKLGVSKDQLNFFAMICVEVLIIRFNYCGLHCCHSRKKQGIGFNLKTIFIDFSKSSVM